MTQDPPVDPKELFEVLVKDHADTLTVFLHSAVRDQALVDDLFQETMLVAWRNMGRFDKNRSFGRWLRGIARNLVMAHRRRNQNDLVLCPEEILGLVDDHCEALQRHRNSTLDEKLTCLHRCIGALPRTYRNTIELRYQKNVRGGRLAEMLKISVASAKKRLLRGRQLLFDCIKNSLELRGMPS